MKTKLAGGTEMATPRPANPNDNFPAATLRHFHDAEILREANSYENALCHYAFSVECAQKALLYWSNHLRSESHSLNQEWQEKVRPLLDAWATLDGGVAAALPNETMPPKLYEDHPSRRYHKSFLCSQQEMDDCQNFSEKMQQTLINMIISGLITDKGGYEP